MMKVGTRDGGLGGIDGGIYITGVLYKLDLNGGAFERMKVE